METKSTKKLGFIGVLLALGVLAGCGPKDTENHTPSNAPTFIEQKFTDFTEGKPSSEVFKVSNGYSNGDPFESTWNTSNIFYNESGLNMKLSKEGNVYYGAEQKTTGIDGLFLYGYFGAYIKPAKVAGTASTFFLYTGESDGNPHDEIDIEFLGKDTTQVQFNYFSNGVGNHEYMYDLGFDASQGFHQYGFYWDSSKIVWYVDLQPVYQVTKDIPTHDMRIFQNFWNGYKGNQGIIDWMGAVNDSELPAYCLTQKITFADLEGNGLVVPEPIRAPKFDELTSIALPFGGNEYYTVSNAVDNKSADVTYSVKGKSYKNFYSSFENDETMFNLFKEKQYFGLKIKNNSTTDAVKVRVDLSAKAGNVPDTQKNAELRNWQDGMDGQTDTKYGGAFFDINPGQESVCIIEYFGFPYRVLLMLDSSSKGTADDTFTGNVTISDYRIGGVQEFEPEEPTEAPEVEPGDYNVMDFNWQQKVPTVEVTKTETEVTFAYTSEASSYTSAKVSNPSKHLFTNPSKAVLTLENKDDSAVVITIAFMKTESSANGSSAGAVVESSTQGTTYTKHSDNNGEYFVLGALDTATLEITLNGISQVDYYYYEIRIGFNTNQESAKSGTIALKQFVITQADGDVEPVAPVKDFVSYMGTWGSLDKATVTVNDDKSSTVTALGAAYAPLQLKDFGDRQDERSGKALKQVTYHIANLDEENEFHGSLQVKDDSALILDEDTISVGGDAEFKRFSSSNGAYFVIPAGGTGSITALTKDGKTATKVRMLLNYDQDEIQTNIRIGEVELYFGNSDPVPTDDHVVKYATFDNIEDEALSVSKTLNTTVVKSTAALDDYKSVTDNTIIQKVLAENPGMKITAITAELTSLSSVELGGALNPKDANETCDNANKGSVTGDITIYKHSSNGIYYKLAPYGHGTVTSEIVDGKVPTRLKLIMDREGGKAASMIVGKITFTLASEGGEKQYEESTMELYPTWKNFDQSQDKTTVVSVPQKKDQYVEVNKPLELVGDLTGKKVVKVTLEMENVGDTDFVGYFGIKNSSSDVVSTDGSVTGGFTDSSYSSSSGIKFTLPAGASGVATLLMLEDAELAKIRLGQKASDATKDNTIKVGKMCVTILSPKEA